MKRITKVDDFGNAYTNEKIYDRGLYSKDGETFYRTQCIRTWDGKPIDRLAEYENLGFTPEELKEKIVSEQIPHSLTFDELQKLIGKPIYNRLSYEWIILGDVSCYKEDSEICQELVSTDGTCFDFEDGVFWDHEV